MLTFIRMHLFSAPTRFCCEEDKLSAGLNDEYFASNVYLRLTGCWLRGLRLTGTQCTPTPSWNAKIKFTTLMRNAALTCIRGYCLLPGDHNAGPRDPRAQRTWGSPGDGNNNGDLITEYSLILPGQETPDPRAACHPWQKCFQECRNDSASSDVWSNEIKNRRIIDQNVKWIGYANM